MTLTGYVHNDTPVQALATTQVTMDFGNEGQITGTAGCNRYFASYKVSGTAITIGQAGSTEMYCGEPGVMDQESAYLILLGQVKTYTIRDDRLSLADAKGTTILSYAKTVPPGQEPLRETTWTLESFHAADAVSSVLAGTSITAVFGPDGSVSGSAGCNHYFAPYTMTETSLSIGPAGSTKMACGTPGVMQQESTLPVTPQPDKELHHQGRQAHLGRRSGRTDPLVCKIGPACIVLRDYRENRYE